VQRIGHTQPRRLAARTVAQRIAHELDTPLGDVVGYQVRFTDQVSDATAVKLMTDGILLNEMQRDRQLRAYDTLIIDEAHERSLNIDFILGYLKQLLPRRPDLKVIVTSATIDVDSFSQHFEGAPIIEVSGRTYPVETHYFDPVEDRDEGVVEQIGELVADISAGRFGPRGDVLVFQSGEREIRELSKHLRHQRDVNILPLYARLSQAEQTRVFDTRSQRGMRVILATNVAETSLTVPGIRYVIDPGEARISRYSFRTKVQRLPIEPISQASANQRQGRCGRVASGVCLRLYSEQDFTGRPEFTDPEIKRTNLAAVILQMLQLRLGDVSRFPFINPPDPRMVRDGYKLLEELGAVTTGGKLTALGKRMARLPIDPRLARMILAGQSQDCLEEVLVIASALAIADPRERPADKQQQADQLHARFKHPRSDFLAWLNLWRYFEEQRQALSQNQLRKLCKKEFLSYLRLREWREVHAQLTIACRQQGIRPRASLREEENYQAVHVALLSGLLSNIAQQHEGREFLGARNRKLQIFPGSSQSKKPPKWLVAAELVETSRVFARTVAAIDPGWVPDVNPSLLKHHYYEPRWQGRSGRVVAYERVSLYGLTLVDKRTVHYGTINPREARELLIREGLMAGGYRQFPDFLKHNMKVLRELEELESRARRRDIIADEQVLFDFYDERLPDDAFTAGRLQAWLKKTPGADQSLRISRELLMARDPGAALTEQFPGTLNFEDMQFRLTYQFEPGKDTDGVSVTVPIALLNRVPQQLFEWVVPGMLRDKCIALTKSLPKTLRKHLVPVPDYVDRALAELVPANSALGQALARVFTTMAGVRIAPDDFNAEALDDYYRMNLRVVDADGKLIAQGRDIASLVQRLRSSADKPVSHTVAEGPAREGLVRWDMDELPREWRFKQAGVSILSYPALVDRGDTAAIELFDYPSEAQVAHRHGLMRLALLQNAQGVKYLRKSLLRGNHFNLALAGAGLDRAALLEDLICGALRDAMDIDAQEMRTVKAFEAALESGRPRLVECANTLEATLLNALQIIVQVRTMLAGLREDTYRESRVDMEMQLAALLGKGFISDTPAEWFSQYPRYAKALRHRLERFSGQVAKDGQYVARLEELSAPLRRVLEARPGILQLCDSACQYRWMLEEFRVSLFAQSLGTRKAVSEKRLNEQWQQVGQWLEKNPH
jgi:ATP-dependent helicase HrpA